MLTRLLVFLLVAGSAFGQSIVRTSLSDAAHYPKLIHAELPLYAPIAWTAHISGTVEIQVTVEHGAVVDAQLKSGSSPYLSNPSLENVKSWQFQSEDRAAFVVTYVYKIEGEETQLPENPKIELDLPRLVKVTARPFRASCSDCVSQKSDGQQSHHDGTSSDHEAGHAEGSAPLQSSTTPKH
jgi:hypothetical protein